MNGEIACPVCDGDVGLHVESLSFRNRDNGRIERGGDRDGLTVLECWCEQDHRFRIRIDERESSIAVSVEPGWTETLMCSGYECNGESVAVVAIGTIALCRNCAIAMIRDLRERGETALAGAFQDAMNDTR